GLPVAARVQVLGQSDVLRREAIMKIVRTPFTVLLLAAMAAPAAVAGCDQNPVDCVVGHAAAGYDYAAKLTVVSTSGMCDGLVQQTMIIGAEDYHPLLNDHQVNYLKTDVYLQTTDYLAPQDHQACWSTPDKATGYMGGNFTDPNAEPWAKGKFD